MIETTSERAPDREERAPWSIVDILVAIGITVVALVVVFTALFLVVRALGVKGDAEDSPAGLTVLLIGQVLLDLIAVAVAAAFSLGKYNLRPSAWGLVWPPRLRWGLIVSVLVACYVALFAYGLIVDMLGIEGLKPESNVPESFFKYPAVVPLAVVLVIVIAPLCEEMFFRGFLFRGLWSRFGLWPAIVGSGFLFALIHFTGVNSVGLILPFTVIGILFAWLAYRTGSLWNSIAVHFLFNSVSMIANLAQRMTQ
jgi:membrane protease YdiL (CAAX protease family)